MGTPYFKSGIVLGDRPVTTTGRLFVSAPLRFNDFLTATEFERTGATPFTGAYVFDTQLTYGYHTANRDENYDQSETIDEYPSGARFGYSMRGSRQSIQVNFTMLTRDEAAMYRRFCQMVTGPEGGRVIEFYNEHGDAIPGRIRSYSIKQDISNAVAQPFNVTISFEVEHTSEQYSYRTGGQINS